MPLPTIIARLFGTIGPQVQAISVGASQSGVVTTLTPQLDLSASFSLYPGSNGNVSLVNGNQLSLAASVGWGGSQVALIQETVGSGQSFRGEIYAVTVSAAAAPTMDGTLDFSNSNEGGLLAALGVVTSPPVLNGLLDFSNPANSGLILTLAA